MFTVSEEQLTQLLSRSNPTLWENILTRLGAWDIAKLDTYIGLELTAAEKARFLDSIRDIFEDSTWVDS
jgi:hypothetical protein